MFKSVFRKWIEYLRSDRYKLCRFRLTNGQNRFSAMGVLADVLIKEYSEGRWLDCDNRKFSDEQQPYKNGFAWYYRPKYIEIDENGKQFKEMLGEVHVDYRVYLPLKQWFWPGLTYEIQDRIYSWSDEFGGYNLARVADALEDGEHYENYDGTASAGHFIVDGSDCS